MSEFSNMVGDTLIRCEKVDDDRLEFESATMNYVLFHDQDCCEAVSIEDICGDLEDLVGSPIVLAEEVSSVWCDYIGGEPSGAAAWANAPKEIPEGEESCTWTFYRIGTVKGTVTVRWFGSSNGLYSESVDFLATKKDN